MGYEIERRFISDVPLAEYGYVYPPGTTASQAAFNFREIAVIAIAKADAALRERQGGGTTLFWWESPASAQMTPEMANCAIAIETDMLERYAFERATTAEALLAAIDRPEHEIRMHLEYGRAMRKQFIREAEVAA